MFWAARGCSMPLPQRFLFLWLPPLLGRWPNNNFFLWNWWLSLVLKTHLSFNPKFSWLRKALAERVTWMPTGRKRECDQGCAERTVYRNIPNKWSEHFSGYLSTAGLFSSKFYLWQLSKGLMVQALSQGTPAAPSPGTSGCRGGSSAIFLTDRMNKLSGGDCSQGS